MARRISWLVVTHLPRVQILADKTLDRILAEYQSGDASPDPFRAQLIKQVHLWAPRHVGEFALESGPPQYRLKPGLQRRWRTLRADVRLWTHRLYRNDERARTERFVVH
jgi:hypothetical protein